MNFRLTLRLLGLLTLLLAGSMVTCLLWAWLDGDGTSANALGYSIVAGLPRDRIKALRAVRETGGAYVRVDDDEILAAIPVLAQGCGVFAEPAAAAAYAGLVKAVRDRLVRADERVVVLATGSGLKDVVSAMKAVGQPHSVTPDLDSVKRIVEELK